MTLSTITSKRLRNLTAALAVILSCLVHAAAQDELTPPKAEVKATCSLRDRWGRSNSSPGTLSWF